MQNLNLHRSASNRKIFGVCGGLSESFNIDVTLIRIIFALLILGWGTGLLLYIIMAFILPVK
jgi:phage shock protein C